MDMNKHAYLIMAHNQFDLLKTLLICLDHPQNDIFIHMDAKTSCDFEDIKSVLKSSACYFTPRCSVTWGGFSQIQAELILLKAATQQGTYAYYHLLTGVDMPLRPQQEILDFFSNCGGKEFISCSQQLNTDAMNRVRYYYPFQEKLPPRTFFAKLFKKAGLILQKLLRTDRTRGTGIIWGIGSAYFDITDKMARYVLQQEPFIQKHFSSSFCADEMFLQTVFLNSPYNKPEARYVSNHTPHPYIQDTYFDVLRAIDWTRGVPYTYASEDYDMLMTSGCLFARKFDWAKDSAVICKIAEAIASE